jgi:tetratricopeptide (TPR) repeat protein
MTADAAAPAHAETDLKSLRALLESGRFEPALRAAESRLASQPEDRDLLYVVAVSERHLGRIPEALATLERLEALYPDYPRLFQERGHCHVARRAAPQAIEAFEQAVRLNPWLPASWKVLAVLYRMSGQLTKAESAITEAARLASLPTAVLSASSMFADGQVADAEALVRRFLIEHGDHIEGMRLLARIGVKHDVLDDAELLLENVLARTPDYHAARYEYAVVLLRRHKHVEAREQMLRLLEIDPGDRIYRTTFATVCMGLGDYERALPLYQQLLRETPQDPELHMSMGHVLKTLGRQEEAIQSYRAAAALRPGFGEVWWSLANLKTYRFTDTELERMRAEEAAPRVRLADRYHFCFALGKALEDRAHYRDSFAHYERGNALKRTECRYRPEYIEHNTRLQKTVCTPEFFAERIGFGSASRAPIFIVGLPRSGSTLIEQILASHSQVEGTMELAVIPRLLSELEGRQSEGQESRYPGVLAGLSAEKAARLGESYLAGSRAYRSGKPRFIDKMPNNFRHIGLMHLILPHAKIIDARRGAMACCFGNLKQLFASGQPFTYSVEDIARYYRTYVELMAHWDRALPGEVLRVRHEELVADFEPQVRRILEFCELDFEPACLEFYKTSRRVHTASSEQVRRPINTEGLEQWRHFAPWLGPLAEALGELAAD